MVQESEDNYQRTESKIETNQQEESNSVPEAYHNEILRLQNIITRLQTQNIKHPTKARSKELSHHSVNENAKEVVRLRKEIESQDKLITSYQTENERLCDNLKNVEKPVINHELEQTAVRLINENTSLRIELESLKKEYKHRTVCWPHNLLEDGYAKNLETQLAQLELNLKTVTEERDRVKIENQKINPKFDQLLKDNQRLINQPMERDLLIDRFKTRIKDLERKLSLFANAQLSADQTVSNLKNQHEKLIPSTGVQSAHSLQPNPTTNQFQIQLDDKAAEHVRTLLIKLQAEICRMKQELFKSRKTIRELKSLRCIHCSTPIKLSIGKI